MIKRNFFRKILLIYMSIVVLYTSVISIITCYKGFEFSQLQTNFSHQRYAEQTSAYIDFKLQTALELIYKISTLESFIDFRYCETTDYVLITNLFNDLCTYLNGFNHAGITLGVAKLTDDIVITSEGTYSHSNFLKESGINPDAISDLLDTNQDIKEYTYIIPSSALESSRKMVILHKLKESSKGVPVYFYITMDTATFLTNRNIYGDFSLYTDQPIVNLANGLGIYNTQTLDFISGMEIPGKLNYLKAGGYVHYVYPSGAMSNLKFIYSEKSTSWISIIFDVLKTSLIPLLLLLAISTWLSFKAVNSTYKPIRALVRFIGDQAAAADETSPSVQDKQTNSELDYIQSNIERIYTINHALQKNLNLSFTRLQEDFFRKIIYGIVDDGFIRENLSPLKLEGFDRPLRMFLLECEGIEHISSIISYKNFSLLIYEIIENFDRLTGPAFVLPLDTKKHCIIIQDETESTLTDLGTYIIDSLSSHLSLDVMVCLSDVYPLSDLAGGLRELLLLNNHKYTFMDQRILTLETIKERKETTYLYPLETETCLINYVSNNEYEKGKDLLSQLIDKNISGLPLSPANITHLKHTLITTFKRSLNVDGKSLNQFIREYPTAVDEFLEIPVADLKTGCLALYDIIFHYCNQDKVSLESSTASKIFIYIQENFDKDISLTDIAGHFQLSESYISKLLKSSLDVNFKTYVNKLKIKKAKELLNKRNGRISDIAAMVGCNNTNTFIRIFKQYEGVSPGEYMKSLK